MEEYFTVFETAWGYAGFAAGHSGITRLLLPLPKRAVALSRFHGSTFDADLMKDVQCAVIRYFVGQYMDFTDWPPVDLSNITGFSRTVLELCRQTGYGRTISYGKLAKRAGKPAAARAVGAILARNPVPLIIPCHRVLRNDGTLGGFSAAGGIKMKKRLLEMESRSPA